MKDLAKIQEFFSKPLGEAQEKDAVDTITMDIPLFLRMLEYSREDASQDMDLHDVTEKANLLGKERGILQMDDYDEIIGSAEEIKEGSTTFKVGDKVTYLGYPAEITGINKEMTGDVTYNIYYDKGTGKTKASNISNKGGEIKEGELSEAYVPSNIKEFAKRKGVSSLVNKVAGWAEKVGKGIRGGTAIGKNYSTLILDMGYQTADIYINTDDETIELYGEPVENFNEFQRVYNKKDLTERIINRLKNDPRRTKR